MRERLADLRRRNEASVHAVKAALLRQDSVAVRDALGKVKPPYSKLFVKFG